MLSIISCGSLQSQASLYLSAILLPLLITGPEVISAWPVDFLLAARQSSTADQAPFTASSELWASVVANVAPIMCLVGERNAKEFLRMSSSRHQLFMMATAPLGILSLMICAIRLSGPRILRRLTGREADPRSAALVELTPLSVKPATSVYTPHAVEIQPSEQRDQVAFVCAHIKQTIHVHEALTSFKRILRFRVNKAKDDSEDYEIVLGMKGNLLTADETAKLVSSIVHEEREIEESLTERVESTSLSFRTTGISPTQTAPIAHDGSSYRPSLELPTLCHACVGLCALTAMTGLQVAGYFRHGLHTGSNGLRILIMGLGGYFGIAIFTFILLVIIKQEIEINPQELGPIFENEPVVWTFSDSRHAQHQCFDKPHRRNLVQAAPKKQQSSRKQQAISTFISAGLMGSFVVYYLALRVAVWWVAFGGLLITWSCAVVRAMSIRGFLTAKDTEPGEHWLGIFRDDLSESLLETVAIMEYKTASSNASSKSIGETSDLSPVLGKRSPLVTVPKPNSEKTMASSDSSSPPGELETTKRLDKSCTLVVVKPIRQSLRNWSGAEDVMKVALEMAKRVCRSKSFYISGNHLDVNDSLSFKRIIRFRLMVYVPGVLWKADTDLDYILTQDLDLPNLYRDILKIFHLCSEVKGTITRYEALTEETSIEVSHVLCGPLAPVPDSDFPHGFSMTLTNLLLNFRKQNPDEMKAYTLDQSLLLPTIQLATMYESSDHEYHSSRIQEMQNGHTDKLALSGDKYLPTLDTIFEEHNVWQHFLTPKLPQGLARPLQPRDETSGLYGKPARRKAGKKEKGNESYWLKDMAFRDRPGDPGQ